MNKSNPAPSRRWVLHISIILALVAAITANIIKNQKAHVGSFTAGYSRDGKPVTAHPVGLGEQLAQAMAEHCPLPV